MTTYWLTFRIAEVNAPEGNDAARRDNLYQVVKEQTTFWWLDPTSFIVFESTSSIEKIAEDCKEVVSEIYDIVLIREMDRKSAVVIGSPEDEDIFSLMTYLKKA